MTISISGGSSDTTLPQANSCTPGTHSVADQPSIIVPIPNSARLYISIYHEGDDDLLLGHGDNTLTTAHFALAVPAKQLITSTWMGKMRAITRNGNPVTVHVREFFEENQ